MLAPALMVQGTASSVGKSLVVTALCRYFRSHGVRVAPFKAQNMSLNSAVTPDGLEIGRAQAVQAQAARIAARVEMNPILLKPEAEQRSQIVLLGKPVGSLSARDYQGQKPAFAQAVRDSLCALRAQYELVLIEGAGSPAEVNLKDRDLVNMFVAREADAPVILVGDIDRGGVFAALVGTLELLTDEERARVQALLINKFRGDLTLLEPGLDFIRERTRKPVLGVLPYLRDLAVADEDSVSLEARSSRARDPERLDIAVVLLPHISNYDDVLALEHEPSVVVRFVRSATEAEGADLLIVPGTKTTVHDFAWLRQNGFDALIAARAERGAPVLGICGGCQMLGERVEDPEGVEGERGVTAGLGLLPLVTRFSPTKVTTQVRARPARSSFLSPGSEHAAELSGYEIHMGRVARTREVDGAFRITRENGAPSDRVDGACDTSGNVVGTLLHGILDDAPLRRGLLDELWRRRGVTAPPSVASAADDAFDRLAQAVSASLDLELLWRLAGLPRR